MAKIVSRVRPNGELCTMVTGDNSIELLMGVEELVGAEGFHGKADDSVCNPRRYGDAALYGATSMMVVNLIGRVPHQLTLVGVNYGESGEDVRATARILALLGFGDEDLLYQAVSWPPDPRSPQNSSYTFRRTL